MATTLHRLTARPRLARPFARPRWPLIAGTALALLLAGSAAARGQSAIQTGATQGPDLRVFPFLGIRAGTPQRMSVSAGVGFDLDPTADPSRPSRELLLVVAPGLGAERGSLTLVHSTGRYGGGVAGGFTVIRTVGHPWQAPANTTYVGADLSILPIIAMGPRLGLLRRVSGNTADRPWLWTLDFGFGF
ncbi:MAG TPA: hypothetical protein VFK16_10740 [Gemmatimonadaceae bacterium]|jgi:hypothetical protein|nr:hypothetical protein [Gemmatimonadaceae bacterium]